MADGTAAVAPDRSFDDLSDPDAPDGGGRRRRPAPLRRMTPPPEAGGQEESEEWVISYMDMVTLLMTVFLGMMAILGMEGKLKPPEEKSAKGEMEEPALPPPPRTNLADLRPNPAPTTIGIPDITPRLPGAAPVVPGRAPTNGDSRTADSRAPAIEGDDDAPAAKTEPGHAPGPEPAQPAAPPLSPAARAWLEALEAAGLPREVGFTVENKRIAIVMRERILFPSGSATLEAGGARVLASLQPMLARMPGTIAVEGHSDSVAISTFRYPSNWELSGARAAAVVRQLIDLGMPPERLRATGYADSRPVSTDPAQRSLNRRVEIVVNDFDAPGAPLPGAPPSTTVPVPR